MTCDELYRIVESQCSWGYRLTDHYYGLAYIERKDLTEPEPGIFVFRFRLPWDVDMHGFDSVVKDVCNTTGSKRRTIVEQKTEYGIPFYECAWVIVVGDAEQAS